MPKMTFRKKPLSSYLYWQRVGIKIYATIMLIFVILFLPFSLLLHPLFRLFELQGFFYKGTYQVSHHTFKKRDP